MLELPHYMTVGAALLTIALTLWWQRGRTGRELPLPPGPPQLPIIGNLLDIPFLFPWIAYTKWAEQFNADILYLNVAGTPLVVLNTFEAATELLDRRSRIYSGRPRYTMMRELLGFDRDFVVMDYGDDWKAHRKLFQRQFSPMQPSHHQSQDLRSARALLGNLLDHPDNFSRHLRYMTGSSIMSVAYGIDILPEGDPYVQSAEEMMDLFISATIFGTFIVDFIPWLRHIPAWFPGAAFKRMANRNRHVHMNTITAPFKVVKDRMTKGAVQDCFVSRCLQQATDNNLSANPELQDHIIKETAGSMYEGGADTTVTAMLTFLLAMARNPAQQARAQEELDRVVGNERLPDHNDRADLPYITAVMNECLRWQPVTPLALPHRLTSEIDDEYNGYRIPKGSTIVANVWAIFHDSKMYPDPDTFNADRWLSVDADGNRIINPDIRDTNIGFGFGRRICPGQHMALSSFWIAIASVLHSFNITSPVDENGNLIEPKVEYVTALQNRPAPFECVIKPRSSKHASLIRSSLIHDSF